MFLNNYSLCSKYVEKHKYSGFAIYVKENYASRNTVIVHRLPERIRKMVGATAFFAKLPLGVA